MGTRHDNAEGLERCLKELALTDEEGGDARTYLVRDAVTNEIAAYFSFRLPIFTGDNLPLKTSFLREAAIMKLFSASFIFPLAHRTRKVIYYALVRPARAERDL